MGFTIIERMFYPSTPRPYLSRRAGQPGNRALDR
jgi:hypothetical protein